MNAYYKMETLEHFAHIAFVALQLGNLNEIGEMDVQKLIDLRSNFGIKTTVSCQRCERSQTEACAINTGRNDEGSSGTYTSTCGTSQGGSSTSDQDALIRSITEAVMKQLQN
jgi:hypothetical protein